MATQIVELTGDESKLLSSIRNSIKKQAELEAGFKSTERTGRRMGNTLAEATTDKHLKQYVRELRKMGPEGRKIASGLRGHFQETGKAGERSMQEILGEMQKIDPASARVAKKMRSEFKAAGKESSQGISSAVASIRQDLQGIVLAFTGAGGVREAVMAVNEHLVEQRQLMESIRTDNITLAQAQETASKNLAGLTSEDRKKLLNVEIPKIIRETGFSDATQLTLAAGDIASSGESDADKIVEALRAGAHTSRLNPDAIGAVASAGSTLARQLDLPDVQSAIALLQTAGTQAKITDPTKLQENLPVVLNAAAKASPGEDPVQLARQVSAFFAVGTQFGGDVQGDTTRSFSLTFLDKMGSFFENIDEEIVNARSRLDTLTGKKDPTDKDALEITRLREFITSARDVDDPGDLIGRIRVLQNDALGRQFFGEGFGEARFQTFGRQLLDATGPALAQIEASFEKIRANRGFFEREAAAASNLTPQLTIGTADARSRAGSAAGRLALTEDAALAQVRSQIGTALGETRGRGIAGFFDKGADFALRGSLVGSTAAEESVSGILQMQSRIDRLRRDGVTPQEMPRIQQLEDEISNTIDLMSDLGLRGALDQEGVGRAIDLSRSRMIGQPVSAGPGAAPVIRGPSEGQEQLLVRMTAILEQIRQSMDKTADNTDPHNAAGRSGLQVPGVTPSLSNLPY